MSIFKILKNGLEFYFILSYEPTIPKTMIPQQKMWAGCYRLLPPTQKRSEFGPWQSLSRDVLDCRVFFFTWCLKKKQDKSISNWPVLDNKFKGGKYEILKGCPR